MIQVITPATTSDLTTTDALRAALGSPPLTDAEVTELRQIVARASDLATRFCARTTFGRETVRQTERLTSSARVIILQRDLAPAITSVTVDGLALASADYELDGALLYRLDSSGYRTTWDAGIAIITYAAGYTQLTDLPFDVEAAAIEIGKALWAGRGRDPSVRSDAVQGVVNISYHDARDGHGGLPAIAAEMLAPWRAFCV